MLEHTQTWWVLESVQLEILGEASTDQEEEEEEGGLIDS